MITSSLAKQERRATVATSSRSYTRGPSREQLTTNLLAKLDHSSSPPNKLEDTEAVNDLANVGECASPKDPSFPKYYNWLRITSTSVVGVSGAGPLVRPRIYTNQGQRLFCSAFVSLANGVQISAAVTFAIVIKVLIDLYRYLPLMPEIKHWGHLSKTELRKPDMTQSPFNTFDPSSTLFQLGTVFSTPQFSAGMSAFSSFTFDGSHFPSGIANIDNSPRMIIREEFRGETCTVASLARLEPDDGDTSSSLFPTKVILPLLSSELRIRLSTRVNGLIWPESSRQVVAAINDSFKLDDLNELMERTPRLFGTRSAKMHAGLITISKNATYISRRGNIDLFALTEKEGIKLINIGSEQPPIAMGARKRSDSDLTQTLVVPHSGNKGVVFLMASPGKFSNLNAEEGKQLYQWASSESGCGISRTPSASASQTKPVFLNFGAVFTCIH